MLRVEDEEMRQHVAQLPLLLPIQPVPPALSLNRTGAI